MNEIDLFFARTVLPGADQAQEAFLALLMAVAREGHLCLDVANGHISPELEFVTEDLRKLVLEGAKTLPSDLRFVRKEDHRWYLERNWKFETKFLYHLKRLMSEIPKIAMRSPENREGLQPEQRQALHTAFTATLSLISGGPGTGKSYVASCIVEEFLKEAPENYRIVLAAPTGKAASHLEAKLPKDPRIQCGTLHRLLNVASSSQMNGEKGYLGADLLIVDECSMIDVRLFSYLLASLETGTRLILMGDEHQLPPVDAGSLFADLLELARGDHLLVWTHLNQCMRSERLDILNLAQSIKKGDPFAVEIGELDPATLPAYFSPPSFEMPPLESAQRFCILSCMRQGPLGVDALNHAIVAHFLTQAKKGHYFVAPILVTKNDYAQELFNGQTGVLVRRIGYENEDKVHFEKREIPAASLAHFEYGFVQSVHKSQGSEYDHVLLLVPPGSEVFGRELLYTAVTRARHKIEIKGNKEVFLQALSRSSRKISGVQTRSWCATG